jgi:predicted porin
MGTAGRVNNAMAYVSPNFSGLTVTAAYTANSETATATTSDRIYALGLDYDNGPLAVSYVHHNIATPSTATAAGTTVATWTALNTACAAGLTTVVTVSNSANTGNINGCGSAAGGTGQTKQKENALAASYDFGVAKIIGSYQTVKNDNLTTATTRENAKIWNLGAAIPVMGTGSVRVGYQRLDDKTPGNDDAKGYNIGYVHAMSKRTNVYGGYAQIKNKNAGAAGLASGLVPNATVADGKSRSYGVGLNHSF